eukprot:Opistho-2@21595
MTPRASVTVTTMGSPSGIAATASDTPMVNISRRLRFWKRPMTTMSPMIANEKMDSFFPSSSMRDCRGVLRSSTSRIRWKTTPNSDVSPVPITMPLPRPLRTSVPMKATFLRSASGCFSSSLSIITRVCFTDGMVSPVSIDSSTSRSTASNRRISAGTRSPMEIWMMSPGTRSVASMSMSCPSRRQWQRCGTSLLRASSDFSLRYSWTNPTETTITTATVMLTASSNCRITTLTMADASRSMMSGSLNCSMNFFQMGSLSVTSKSFSPCFSLRTPASTCARPRSGSTRCWCSTSTTAHVAAR